MKRFIDYVPRGFNPVLSSSFLAVSIVQYLAYYEGLLDLFQDITGRWAIVMAIVLTYMFRLDIIAASIGFWGTWAVWHWPLWVAILLTAIFQSLSLAINYGPGKNPKSFMQRLWARRKAKS